MNNKGFSLIEMLVVVLIFTIVMGIAIGVFTSAIKLQRYNLAYQQLLSQVSYAMEYIDRSIRMAVENDGITCATFPAGQNYRVSDGGRKIEFKRYMNGAYECQQFYWNITNNRLISYNTDISNDALSLTSGDLKVTKLIFNVTGDVVGSQPKVTIVMEIEANNAIGPKPRIKIQTTVSQRNLNM